VKTCRRNTIKSKYEKTISACVIQASAVKQARTVFFKVITERVVVICF